MPEADRNVALLSSLRGLVRGLSALFWGLPAALVIAFQTGKGDWFKSFGFAPITMAMGLLLYGTLLLGSFQSQERIWTSALFRARLVAIINLGLSPFLFFWNKVPGHLFFIITVDVMFLTLLAFLYLVNTVLLRLAAMLPDETLRGETKVFARLNQAILLVIIGSAPFYFVLHAAGSLPRVVVDAMLFLERGGEVLELLLLLMFILLPVAMTMALLWKTKEVIMASVFAHAGNDPLPPPASER